MRGWAGGAGPGIANGAPGLPTRKRRWLCSVPPKAQSAQESRWHRAGVGHGSIPSPRARDRLAGAGRR